MEVRQRKFRGHLCNCSTPGCSHSASCEVILLGTEFIALCTRCRKTWEEGWDHALNGWPDERRELVAA